jgi:hypothetical protein
MKKVSWRYVATVLMLLVTLAGYGLSERREPEYLARPLETIDKQITGWTMTGNEPLGERVLERLQLTSYISRIYEKQGTKLGLFMLSSVPGKVCTPPNTAYPDRAGRSGSTTRP